MVVHLVNVVAVVLLGVAATATAAATAATAIVAAAVVLRLRGGGGAGRRFRGAGLHGGEVVQIGGREGHRAELGEAGELPTGAGCLDRRLDVFGIFLRDLQGYEADCTD